MARSLRVLRHSYRNLCTQSVSDTGYKDAYGARDLFTVVIIAGIQLRMFYAYAPVAQRQRQGT